MVVAPAVPCCPSSSSFALPDVFSIITAGLRDFTKELYSESSGQVCLNSALVAMPLVWAHSSSLQSWLVTSVNSKMSSSARMPLPPPASDDYSFWEHWCGIQRVGAGSVSDWVGVHGRKVGCEGNCDEYRER